MSEVAQGIPGAPGLVTAPAYVVRWPGLDVPHATVRSREVGAEIERFRAACRRAKARTRELRATVEERLGPVQAKIFDPQLLMLEDDDLVEATATYIRDSSLTAERAFNLRVLEFRAQWLNAPHARVVDRLADLSDVQGRVLAALRDAPITEILAQAPDGPFILVTDDLTPSRLVELDPERVAGLATDAGTRTSHMAILARSARIPTVVGLGTLTEKVRTGDMIVLDGHRGRVLVDPSEAELTWFRELDVGRAASSDRLRRMAGVEPVTADGTRIRIYANLELPADAATAAAAGVDGVGLFRTEFLVIGESAIPDEDEQYEAFREVVETFAPDPVVIRTYDLGGDKFPIFLPPLEEENPFLGWRGVRLYSELPELFRKQVRAALRAAAHGTVRLLLPMVDSVEEVEEARSAIETARSELEEEGVEHALPALGVMLETPAAVAIVDVLARHVDFFSLGTNDLVQYVLAVDRSNARLARYYDLFHPGVVRAVRGGVAAANEAGTPLTLCGEAASDALGVYLMIGLGIRAFSVAPSAVPELKTLVRAIEVAEAERVARNALQAETATDIRGLVQAALDRAIDVSSLTATGSLSRPG